MNSPKTAFILLTHFLAEEIFAEYKKIKLSSRSLGDAWILLQNNESPLNDKTNHAKIHLCTDRDIHSLIYPTLQEGVIPGNAHFPLLHFFHIRQKYDYYWLIEYDVRYSGTWRHLFRSFRHDPTDLLTSHIRKYPQEPDWPHWKLAHPKESIPLEERTRSFNPIYRISHSALAAIHEAHQDGWKGHNEVLLPTLISRSRFSISDFGGEGPFVPSHRTNKFYIAKLTLRYRPIHERTRFYRNKIYHPVKPSPAPPWKRSLISLISQTLTYCSYRHMHILNDD